MNHVVVERRGRAGCLILDRPKALNALDRDMIDALADGLARHVADDAVELVVVRSADARAFCAGGDMKRARELVLEERYDDVDAFFEAEYALNLAIADCPKPYVALIDGVAMGGGLGLSVHGSHRVVTERATLAMPEGRIGFFPDVGASRFLTDLPYRGGWWMALSAESIDAPTAFALGIATHRVASSRLEGVVERLENDASASVDEILDAARDALPPAGAPIEWLERRGTWFAADTADAIDDALDDAALHSEDAERLQRRMRALSPHSVETTLALFREARGLSLTEALERERAAARDAVRHPDFVEGIRSVLVDRDANTRPKWARRRRQVDAERPGTLW